MDTQIKKYYFVLFKSLIKYLWNTCKRDIWNVIGSVPCKTLGWSLSLHIFFIFNTILITQMCLQLN